MTQYWSQSIKRFLRIVIFMFSLFLATATDGHLRLPSHINLKPLHLQIILTDMPKFCSTLQEILASRQNRAHKQEVGHCDHLKSIHNFSQIYQAILEKWTSMPGSMQIFQRVDGHCGLKPPQVFFILISITNTSYKISAKYTKPFWRKNPISLVLLFLVLAAILKSQSN